MQKILDFTTRNFHIAVRLEWFKTRPNCSLEFGFPQPDCLLGIELSSLSMTGGNERKPLACALVANMGRGRRCSLGACGM